MVSKEQKKASAALHEKLQLLRSLTNSHAQRETSIILDAAKYIQELKQKVERLNQDVETTGETSRHGQDSWPEVVVESLETGFLVNIYSDKSCPGLLVSILEVFDELGLHVMEARVSCADSFRLEAFGGENNESGETVDTHAVKHAVTDAIRNWSQTYDAN
ncbi:Transcription factor bHLH61 [Heracleum sosnowskyi]|uniref:Transcription factor bHLH61 n=1 Tax=Heracleum sosnowskyi TaxID=360622 RepID=A0AAD8I2R4_9APIA|nr:Transcription factor bHLH61 [Heracleum sosnowskyi]